MLSYNEMNIFLAYKIGYKFINKSDIKSPSDNSNYFELEFNLFK